MTGRGPDGFLSPRRGLAACPLPGAWRSREAWPVSGLYSSVTWTRFPYHMGLQGAGAEVVMLWRRVKQRVSSRSPS